MIFLLFSWLIILKSKIFYSSILFSTIVEVVVVVFKVVKVLLESLLFVDDSLFVVQLSVNSNSGTSIKFLSISIFHNSNGSFQELVETLFKKSSIIIFESELLKLYPSKIGFIYYPFSPKERAEGRG